MRGPQLASYMAQTEGNRRQAMPLYTEALGLAKKSAMEEGIKINQRALDRMQSVPL
jgi:hypothetical protein